MAHQHCSNSSRSKDSKLTDNNASLILVSVWSWEFLLSLNLWQSKYLEHKRQTWTTAGLHGSSIIDFFHIKKSGTESFTSALIIFHKFIITEMTPWGEII